MAPIHTRWVKAGGKIKYNQFTYSSIKLIPHINTQVAVLYDNDAFEIDVYECLWLAGTASRPSLGRLIELDLYPDG